MKARGILEISEELLKRMIGFEDNVAIIDIKYDVARNVYRLFLRSNHEVVFHGQTVTKICPEAFEPEEQKFYIQETDNDWSDYS